MTNDSLNHAADAVFDADALARLRALDPDGSRAFVRQILSTYEVALQRHLARLDATDAACAAGAVAHTLKSSSASIGALALVRCCTDVERALRNTDSSDILPALQAMKAEAARVLAALRTMLKS